MMRRNAKLVCVAGHRRDEYTAEPARGHQEIYEPRNTRLEVYSIFGIFFKELPVNQGFLSESVWICVGIHLSCLIRIQVLKFCISVCKKRAKIFVLLFFIFFFSLFNSLIY
jgi:hypothetical protein